MEKVYTYRDTNHSDMEEVFTKRTELAYIQDLSISEHNPQVKNELSYQSTITEVSTSHNSSTSEQFVGSHYNLLDLTSIQSSPQLVQATCHCSNSSIRYEPAAAFASLILAQ
jgi:hypothetical protein